MPSRQYTFTGANHQSPNSYRHDDRRGRVNREHVVKRSAELRAVDGDAESEVCEHSESGDEAGKETNEEDDSNAQEKDDRFYRAWDRFTRTPPPPTRSRIAVLDEDVDGKHKQAVGRNAEGLMSRENAAATFEEAAQTCRAKVRAIVAECRKLNKKYYDPLFDLVWRREDCLVSLSGQVRGERPFMTQGEEGPAVADVKRVGNIFEDPHFFAEDGPVIDEVRQGGLGNCWFLASVTALLGMPEYIERICVDRDEQVGVYGFCFHRDGAWVSTVVDDHLCLMYHQNQRHELVNHNPDGSTFSTLPPKDFAKSIPKGPDALYFASCKDSDQTWLPLLEKAYAKVHLSYQAIDGGFAGEGIEDLTGGVNSSIQSDDVLDKDTLWNELLQVNKNFLFGCGSRQALYENQTQQESSGVISGHAYTVLGAKEISYIPRKPNKSRRSAAMGDSLPSDTQDEQKSKTDRLLKVRNPWGSSEWTGAWSDGSEEWSPKTMAELNHSFGDDGIFWISLDDFLDAFPSIDRTRLFGAEWTVAQQWTTVNVPRTIDYSDTDYLPTSFKVKITKTGPVTFLLSKPDDRYFGALRGRYSFELHFKLFKENEHEYIVRSMSSTASGRSVSAELDCEPGYYILKIKLTPWRSDRAKTAVEIIKDCDKYGREKVLAVGKMFDIAHARGRLREAEIKEASKIKNAMKQKQKAKAQATREKERARRRKEKLALQRIARKEEAISAKERARQKRDAPPMDDDTPQDPSASVKLVGKGGDYIEIPLTVEQAAELGLKIKDSADIGPATAQALGLQPPSKDLNTPAESETQAGETESSSTNKTEDPPTLEEATAPTAEKPAEETEAAAIEAAESTVEDHKTESKSGEQPLAGNENEDESPNIDETASDFGSVQDDDFSWDSSIDDDDEVSDDEAVSNDGDSKSNDGGRWYALATVGLRIYSKDPDASIEVEHADEEQSASG